MISVQSWCFQFQYETVRDRGFAASSLIAPLLQPYCTLISTPIFNGVDIRIEYGDNKDRPVHYLSIFYSIRFFVTDCTFMMSYHHKMKKHSMPGVPMARIRIPPLNASWFSIQQQKVI